MGEIKSAREIAAEKVQQMGAVTEDERLKWKYTPEGEKLVATYLKEGANLVVDLSHYEATARKYVVAGAKDILVRNLTLPKTDAAKKNNKKAMEGLKVLVGDKVAAENIFSGIRRIFDHYVGQGEQQRRQAYEQLKLEFAEKLQQAMQQQGMGSFSRANIDIERQPQFQEEWRKLQVKLDMQYIKLLDEYKHGLLALS